MTVRDFAGSVHAGNCRQIERNLAKVALVRTGIREEME